MLVDVAWIFAIACIVLGVGGFLWNFSLVTVDRWRRRVGVPAASSGSKTAAASGQFNETDRSADRRLYERAIALVRENRIVDGAKILEEIGLNREAAAVLEQNGMIHEAAAVFLRRKRYHRAGEVYARHRMWEQAGNCYLLAAGAPVGRPVRPGKESRAGGTDVNLMDTVESQAP